MAFSGVVTRGNIAEESSDTTISRSPSGDTVAVGKLLIAVAVTDNYATADGASNEHSISDNVGNTWTKIGEYTETDGVAADGVTISMFWSVITTQLLITDSVTLTCANAVTAKILGLVEATIEAGNTIQVEQVGIGQGAISASVSSMPSREYLLIGLGGAEGNDLSKTADADYTEIADTRSSSTAGTAVGMHTVTRIATLTSDTCTSSDWTNTNPMFMLAAVYETLYIAPIPHGRGYIF